MVNLGEFPLIEIVNINGDDGICTKINRYLNRYHEIDEHLKASLKYGYLWFSDPSGFNDPYDCNMSLGVDCTYNELWDYITTINQEQNLKLSYEFMKARTKQLFDNPEQRQSASNDGDKKTVATLGVCCFSEHLDSLLMWSHYSGKHKGLCLTFDVKKKFVNGALYSVEYPTTYPIHHWPRDLGKFNSYRYLIATKSKDWEYEREVRIVRDSTKPPFRGEVHFDKESLVAIHFGYKCPINDIDLIKDLLRESGNYNHVKLFKAELKPFEFGITYKAI